MNKGFHEWHGKNGHEIHLSAEEDSVKVFFDLEVDGEKAIIVELTEREARMLQRLLSRVL